MQASKVVFSKDASPELYARNLKALIRANPGLPGVLEAVEGQDLQLQLAKDGYLTGCWDGRRLASQHRPSSEAAGLTAEVDLCEVATVCVLGFGLGLHVEQLAQRMGRSGLVIVLEPDVSLLKSVLSRIDVSDWVEKSNVLIVTDPTDRADLVARLSGMDAILMLGMRILEHPSSIQRVAGVAQDFTRVLAELAANARMTVVTTLARSAETVANVLSNIDHYALGPGVDDLSGAARGCLGIVVSAGPSLRRNMHLLANPDVRDHCVIIATQTTLRPLLDAGVVPHFVTALDYHEISTRFYEGITSDDVMETELVIDPKVNPAVPDSWPGRVRSIASAELDRFLGTRRNDEGELQGCATVAHLAYALARYLGCNPVALIGQDLGFTDGLYYSPGTAIHEVWLPEMNTFNTIETMEWERIARHRGQLSARVDVHGKTIYTDQQMLTYLQQFEGRFLADKEKGLLTFDATEGGLSKENAEPKPLQEILDAYASCDVPIQLPMGTSNCTTTAEEVASQLKSVRKEVKKIIRASKNAHAIIEKMIESQSDTTRMNQLFKDLSQERECVSRHQDAFKLVDLVNQAGVFRRLKADRRLDLSVELDDFQRQRLQLDRDLVNVEWTADAAEELTELLQDSIQLVSEGVPCESRRRIAKLEREAGFADCDIDAVRVAAVVPVDPSVGGSGVERVITKKFAGRSILQCTLERLGTSVELSEIVLLVTDEFEVEDFIDKERIGLPVSIHRCGKNVFDPGHEAIRAARAFADTSWRGGIHGLSVYDEVFSPEATQVVLEEGNFHAALLVGSDWALLPVRGDAGVDHVVRRYREQPRLGCTFNQAPPGLGGLVLAKEVVAEFAKQRIRQATLGNLLGYRPEHPEHDLLARDNNVRIPPSLRSASHRCIFDTPRQQRVLSRVTENLVETNPKHEVNPIEVIDGAHARLLDRAPMFGPQHVTIELCTGRSSGGISRRNLAGNAQRVPMTESLFRSIVSELGKQRDCVLSFDGAGDPLRHPEFDKYVVMAKEYGIRAVHIRTELDVQPELVDRLLKCEPDVVSIDLNGDSAATRFAMHGVDQWHRINENIERLIAGRRILSGEGESALALPWIVPRLQRRAESLEDLPSFFERWRRRLGTGMIDGIPPDHRYQQQPGDVLVPTWAPRRFHDEQSMRRMTILSDGQIPIDVWNAAGEDVVGDVSRHGVMESWFHLVEARKSFRSEGFNRTL